ncbi:4-phytase/acid phosphatase [Oxalobacteraceae bacterium GrIS 2.11]
MSVSVRIFLMVLVCMATVDAGAGEPDADQNSAILERVVLLMRHGVRPPTKSAAAMASQSDTAWPDEQVWAAAPGELTPHGALAIRRLGTDLRNHYVHAGFLPAMGSIAAQSLIWADAADQRTRETAKMLALGMRVADSQAADVGWSKEMVDPLFDGLHSNVCKLDPDLAVQAAAQQAALETPETSAAMAKMQAVLAPDACQRGPGMCLAGPNKITATDRDIKISGPLSIAATASEIFLLEYENGLPMDQVGFGRVSTDDIARLLSIHELSARITRRNSYVAARRAYALTRFILAAIAEPTVTVTTPAINPEQRLIVLTGHDTNLSNLAGVFGLDWHLAGQPDTTAPGTTIAFERWRENSTGKPILKVRLFYQDMEQVRNLSDTPARTMTIEPAACDAGKACDLTKFLSTVKASLPTDCAF